MIRKALVFILILFPMALAHGQADPYEGRTTDNDGLGKYERINLIERKVLGLEDKLKSSNPPSKEIELLKAQMQEMKKEMDSLKELNSLKEEVTRLARKSAQLEVELAILKNRREEKPGILPTPVPTAADKEEVGT
jgi:cell shape-determining protein MreC